MNVASDIGNQFDFVCTLNYFYNINFQFVVSGCFFCTEVSLPEVVERGKFRGQSSMRFHALSHDLSSNRLHSRSINIKKKKRSLRNF